MPPPDTRAVAEANRPITVAETASSSASVNSSPLGTSVRRAHMARTWTDSTTRLGKSEAEAAIERQAHPAANPTARSGDGRGGGEILQGLFDQLGATQGPRPGFRFSGGPSPLYDPWTHRLLAPLAARGRRGGRGQQGGRHHLPSTAPRRRSEGLKGAPPLGGPSTDELSHQPEVARAKSDKEKPWEVRCFSMSSGDSSPNLEKCCRPIFASFAPPPSPGHASGSGSEASSVAHRRPSRNQGEPKA